MRRPLVCDCAQVTPGQVRRAFARGARDLDGIARATGATTGCGRCRPEVARQLRRLRWRARLGAWLGI